MAAFVSRCFAVVTVGIVTLGGAPQVEAQAGDPNPGRMTFTAGLDFANAYMFRGLRQEDTELVMWPFVEGAANLYSSDEGIKSVTAHIGSWNSLHTGATGSDGISGKMWYESDLYGTLSVAFGPDIAVGATYTAYMSPNNAFHTVKEIAFKVAVDDNDTFSDAGFNPYALIAFELDTLPGIRQADAGQRAGTYLEFGVAPGWTDPAVTIAFPIKVGLSLKDYYELAAVDQRFGFLSLAAIASVPLGTNSDFGSWNVHGGVEFLSLGNTPEAFNGGDQTKFVMSVGIGVAY
jgi:hypothetical protein